MRAVIITFSIVSLLFATAVSAQSGTTSEELPPIDCGDQLVTSVSCEGRFCDNVTVTCGGPSRTVSRTAWTERISEENRIGGCFFSDGRRHVPEPEGKFAGFISGLSCGGHFCDDIFLRCTLIADATPGRGAECVWTRFISEEVGPRQMNEIAFPEGHAATAMRCRGSNCDEKSFFMCRILPR